jgi:Domain of unknown function (DUF4397)
MTIRMGRWLLQAGVVVTLGACGKEVDPPPPPDATEIRFIHASPNAPAIDVYLVDPAFRRTLVFANVAYGSATQFKSVTPGSWAVLIGTAGVPPGSTNAGVLTGIDTVLTKDRKVDLVAAGLANSVDPARGIRVLVLEEAFGSTTSSTIRMRTIHASPDAPTLALDFGADGTLETDGLERFADTGASGVELPSSTSTRVRVLVEEKMVTSFTVPSLPSGTRAVFVMTGFLGKYARDFDGLAVVAPGVGLLRQDPGIYFLNLNFGLPPLDIHRSDRLFLDDVTPGTFLRMELPPGPAGLFVFCPTPDVPPADSCLGYGLPEFHAGEQYFWMVGPSSNDTGIYPEDFDLISTEAQLRFVNASPEHFEIDVGLVSGGTFTVLDGLGALRFYPDDGNYWNTTLPPGPVTLGFRPTGTATVFSFDTVLEAGSKAFAVFSASQDEPGGPHLFLLDTTLQPWNLTAITPNP